MYAKENIVHTRLYLNLERIKILELHKGIF
jgi:hypothetical protein